MLIKENAADIERTHGAIAIEIKKIDPKTGVVEGWGARFKNIDSHNHMMDKSNFGKIVAGDIRMLAHHRTDKPIGVWTSIVKKDEGLWVKGQLSINKNVPAADEMYSLLKDGAIDGLSIGFQGIDSEWVTETQKGKEITYLRWKKVKLMEISFVTFPSNPDTRTGKVKSLPTKRDLEKATQDAGLTRSQARTFLAGGYKALTQDAKAIKEPSQVEVIAELKASAADQAATLTQLVTLTQNIATELQANAKTTHEERAK